MTVRPFLKWAGGKGQLLPTLTRCLPKTFRRYHEPFVGGGALFFHLHQLTKLRHGATLSDRNPELVDCYAVIKEEVELLIEALSELAPRYNDREFFYEIRGRDREPGYFERTSRLERAARTIFLNRTCYNGLYRLNKKGFFNAPFGNYKKPRVLNPENLRAVSAALRDVELVVSDFTSIVERVHAGDLVYFDPPYVPISATASFTNYTGHGFGEVEQRALAKVFGELQAKDCFVMLSNSYSPLARELYENQYYSTIVQASRKINCQGHKRGFVEELIACTYPFAESHAPRLRLSISTTPLHYGSYTPAGD